MTGRPRSVRQPGPAQTLHEAVQVFRAPGRNALSDIGDGVVGFEAQVWRAFLM